MEWVFLEKGQEMELRQIGLFSADADGIIL